MINIVRRENEKPAHANIGNFFEMIQRKNKIDCVSRATCNGSRKNTVSGSEQLITRNNHDKREKIPFNVNSHPVNTSMPG